MRGCLQCTLSSQVIFGGPQNVSQLPKLSLFDHWWLSTEASGTQPGGSPHSERGLFSWRQACSDKSLLQRSRARKSSPWSETMTRSHTAGSINKLSEIYGLLRCNGNSVERHIAFMFQKAPLEAHHHVHVMGGGGQTTTWIVGQRCYCSAWIWQRLAENIGFQPCNRKIAGYIHVQSHFATPFSKEFNLAMLTVAAIAPTWRPVELSRTTLGNLYTFNNWLTMRKYYY